MDENLPARDLIDDSVRFEMDFPVAAYTDTLKFGRAVASTWHLGQALAGLLEFNQQMGPPGYARRLSGHIYRFQIYPLQPPQPLIPDASCQVLSSSRDVCKCFLEGLVLAGLGAALALC